MPLDVEGSGESCQLGDDAGDVEYSHRREGLEKPTSSISLVYICIEEVLCKVTDATQCRVTQRDSIR